jgi:hypothetical protein
MANCVSPAAMAATGAHPPGAQRRSAFFLAACAAGLIPWTVGLAVTLPHRYVVGTWTLTWTGFDVALIGCFAVTAWALWKQRQIALPATITTTVLLLCDAWFDLLTAHRGGSLLVSAATALFGEIPIAIIMACIATRLMRAHNGHMMGQSYHPPVAIPRQASRFGYLQVTEPAGVKDQRPDAVIGVEIVHSQDGNVVVSRRDDSFDAGIQPATCRVAEDRAVYCCAPAKTGEPIVSTRCQLTSCLGLVGGKNAYAEAGRLP